MSDKSQDELRKRFNRATEDDRPSDPSEMNEKSQTDQTNENGETGEPTQSQPQSDGLKERKQVAMYLPADQRDALADFYEQLDARSTLAGDGGLEKNREFYEGMVRFVLDRREEFGASLGIEISDD